MMFVKLFPELLEHGDESRGLVRRILVTHFVMWAFDASHLLRLARLSKDFRQELERHQKSDWQIVEEHARV